MYCENCGNELEKNVNFCSECGAEINSSNKDYKDSKVEAEKTDEEWEPCPRCGSNAVEPISKAAIAIAMWVASFVLTIFLPPIGIIGLGISLLASIAFPFMNTTMLKCSDCNKSWKYPANEENEEAETVNN